MKNKLFRTAATKATALAVGSLVVLSGQALAFSPDNQEMTNTGVLDNSELLIARGEIARGEAVEPAERIAIAESISLAITDIGRALAVSQASSIPIGGKIAIARSISEAITILGDARAESQSIAVSDDALAVAESIALAESFVGDAQAIAISFASGEDSVAISFARAVTAVGDAEAVAVSVAQ